MSNELGQWIEKERKKRGWSQRKLAHEAGISQAPDLSTVEPLVVQLQEMYARHTTNTTRTTRTPAAHPGAGPGNRSGCNPAGRNH